MRTWMYVCMYIIMYVSTYVSHYYIHIKARLLYTHGLKYKLGKYHCSATEWMKTHRGAHLDTGCQMCYKSKWLVVLCHTLYFKKKWANSQYACMHVYTYLHVLHYYIHIKAKLIHIHGLKYTLNSTIVSIKTHTRAHLNAELLWLIV